MKALRHCMEPKESLPCSIQPANSPYSLQMNRANTSHYISLRSNHPVISINSAQILQSSQFSLFPRNILHLLFPLTVAYTPLSWDFRKPLQYFLGPSISPLMSHFSKVADVFRHFNLELFSSVNILWLAEIESLQTLLTDSLSLSFAQISITFSSSAK